MRLKAFVLMVVAGLPVHAQSVPDICREASGLASAQGELLTDLWQRMATLEATFSIAAQARGSDDWRAASQILTETLEQWRQDVVIAAANDLGARAATLTELCQLP
jgi:hypothetical protein